MNILLGNCLNGSLKFRKIKKKEGIILRRPEKPSQQKLISIRISHLKGINNLVDMFFKEDGLTAIMGVNCCGKSTVLHALLCSFWSGKDENGKTIGGYRQFKEFFIPDTENKWDNSEFWIKSSFREKNKVIEVEKKFYKGVDRWSRTESRFIRPVYYVGIDSCVPDVERLRISDMNNSNPPVSLSDQCKEKCRYILDKSYDEVETYANERRKAKMRKAKIDTIKYTSFSMGAGEQRVFRIIECILSASKYSLILIDEIDLLLHINALKRLIKTISDIAIKNHLQIIFTTHSMIMNECRDNVKINYMVTEKDTTSVYDGIPTEFIYEMTGSEQIVRKIYVEDVFSEAIINTILLDIKKKKETRIFQYGVVENSYTLASGLVLSQKNNSYDILIVQDGDTDSCQSENRLSHLEKHLSGHSVGNKNCDHLKNEALTMFTSYNTDVDPERKIWSLIKSLKDTQIETHEREIYEAIIDAQIEKDNHDLVKTIVERFDIKYDVAVDKILSLAKKSISWDEFIEPVKNRILNIKEENAS